MFTNKQVVSAAGGCGIVIAIDTVLDPKNVKARKRLSSIILLGLTVKFLDNLVDDWKNKEFNNKS